LIVAMTGPTISIGLGARGLRDRDFLSLSDPYVTIARPDTGGGFRVVRTSETKKNTLNPDWNDFLLVESELNGNNKELKLRIQVFDDDGKIGPDKRDQHIGTGFFSLKELEAAALVNAGLPLTDGKRQKTTGQLLVRSFKEHFTGHSTSSGIYGNMAGIYAGGATNTAQHTVNTGGYPQVRGPYPQVGGPYPQGGGQYPQGQDSDILGNWARINRQMQNDRQRGAIFPQDGGTFPQVGGVLPHSYLQGGGVHPQGGLYPQQENFQQGGAYHQGGAYPQVHTHPPEANLYPSLGSTFPQSNNNPGSAGGFFIPNM